jgi:hypothetical protein
VSLVLGQQLQKIGNERLHTDKYGSLRFYLLIVKINRTIDKMKITFFPLLSQSPILFTLMFSDIFVISLSDFRSKFNQNNRPMLSRTKFNLCLNLMSKSTSLSGVMVMCNQHPPRLVKCTVCLFEFQKQTPLLCFHPRVTTDASFFTFTTTVHIHSQNFQFLASKYFFPLSVHRPEL